MSNDVFPTLQGLGWDRVASPVWSTIIKQAASGKERRLALWSYPRWDFKLSYEFLEDDGATKSDLRQIVGFFNSRMGAFESFLYEHPSDNCVTGQVLGMGDGSTKSFIFIRNYGNWVEPVSYIKGNPVIYINEVKQTSGYTVSGNVLTFDKAPQPGTVITADFYFYFRVRFAEDSIEPSNFMRNLYELKTLELVGVK